MERFIFQSTIQISVLIEVPQISVTRHDGAIIHFVSLGVNQIFCYFEISFWNPKKRNRI